MEPIFTLETHSANLMKELLEAGYIVSSDNQSYIHLYGKTPVDTKDENLLNQLSLDAILNLNPNTTPAHLSNQLSTSFNLINKLFNDQSK